MDPRSHEVFSALLTGGASRRTVLRRLGAGGLVAGVGLGLPRRPARAQGTPPAESAPIPTAWAVAWNAHDTDRVLALYTADATYEDVGFDLVVQGTEQLRAFAAGFFQVVPDLNLALTSAFQTDGWAAAEWLWTGTDQGIFPDQGATGKPFSVRGASIWELRDGKIRRNADHANVAALLRQLGIYPEAGTPPA